MMTTALKLVPYYRREFANLGKIYTRASEELFIIQCVKEHRKKTRPLSLSLKYINYSKTKTHGKQKPRCSLGSSMVIGVVLSVFAMLQYAMFNGVL